jgi:hypothetical protein
MPSIEDAISAIKHIQDYSINIYGKGMHIYEMNLRIKALQEINK